MARPAANEARSASTASIWVMASVRPSSMPISIRVSRSAREEKYVVVVTREPWAASSKTNTIRVDGSEVWGLPSGAAKPSHTSKPWPGSTASHSQ